MEQYFAQILLLLGAAVAIVVAFQRMRIPSSLGYLLVGVLLGPHTIGPVVDTGPLRVLAEFGIVFLLFTIGLNFSLRRIQALRHQVFGLGTGQVVLTTFVVGMAAWLAGVPAAAAFVVGAVFAQSSTTIISKQLGENGEQNNRHGRLGTAMSVFQDVTAVPFVVVIPVLGTAAGADALAGALGWALGKAVLAVALVFFAGRWLLRPLFHIVAELRSAEVFTLTVLLVSLAAAWTTHSLGLSMAFGAFLAGMMLGETEFRHQVESTIRPFRDVLLGLFFVGIGTLFDPASITQIWEWALLGTLLLLLSKTLLVTLIVRLSGIDMFTAWRIGLLLAVGGEFGFALLALALNAGVVDAHVGQIALTSVLLSMIVAPFLIRHNGAIATRLAALGMARSPGPDASLADMAAAENLRNHVVICGYGRIGQSVARFLEREQIPFAALDLDPARVKVAHMAGEFVFYGDAAERDMLEAMGVHHARLLVISHEDVAAALKALYHARALRPELPVMVRTRDESHVDRLLAAGATSVVPETLEAGLMIASQALLLLDIPATRVVRAIQEQRSARYPLLREYYRGETPSDEQEELDADRLRSVVLSADSPAVGLTVAELRFNNAAIAAVIRNGRRDSSPPRAMALQADDVLVLFGAPADLQEAERRILGLSRGVVP